MSSYEETFWCVKPGRDASVPRADKKHRELKSFGRFWYQEIRDFLNSKRTVSRRYLNAPLLLAFGEIYTNGRKTMNSQLTMFLSKILQFVVLLSDARQSTASRTTTKSGAVKFLRKFD
jgi:hypothetical protein